MQYVCFIAKHCDDKLVTRKWSNYKIEMNKKWIECHSQGVILAPYILRDCKGIAIIITFSTSDLTKKFKIVTLLSLIGKSYLKRPNKRL